MDPELRLSDADKRRVRNCDNEDNRNFALLWAPEVKRCPKTFLTADAWEALRIWFDWRDFQALPFDGGMNDQPMWVYEIIQLCTYEANEAFAKKAEE